MTTNSTAIERDAAYKAAIVARSVAYAARAAACDIYVATYQQAVAAGEAFSAACDLAYEAADTLDDAIDDMLEIDIGDDASEVEDSEELVGGTEDREDSYSFVRSATELSKKCDKVYDSIYEVSLDITKAARDAAHDVEASRWPTPWSSNDDE